MSFKTFISNHPLLLLLHINRCSHICQVLISREVHLNCCQFWGGGCFACWRLTSVYGKLTLRNISLDTYYIYRLTFACQYKGGSLYSDYYRTLCPHLRVASMLMHYPSSSCKESSSNYTVHHSLWNFTVRQPTLMKLL